MTNIASATRWRKANPEKVIAQRERNLARNGNATKEARRKKITEAARKVRDALESKEHCEMADILFGGIQ